MIPDPDRKPTKSEMRTTGMVATAVLVFLAIVVVHAWAMNRYDRLAATAPAHSPEAAPDV